MAPKLGAVVVLAPVLGFLSPFDWAGARHLAKVARVVFGMPVPCHVRVSEGRLLAWGLSGHR